MIKSWHCSSKGKIFTCFAADLKKAFDSVWHKGLFNKLLKSYISGKTYNLIKSMYQDSTCCAKINDPQTPSFSYTVKEYVRGVC